MVPAVDLNLLDNLLWEALHQPLGLVVHTADPTRLRQLLYRARRANRADFAPLKLTVMDGQVWILNREAQQELLDHAPSL